MQIEHIKPARSGKPAGHLRRTLVRDFKMNKWKYLIILPVIVYFAIFAYKPMYGVIIAFKNYRPSLGILDSPWVGLLQFKLFFRDIYFWRLLRNTFCISGLSILFGFPAPIILALLLIDSLLLVQAHSSDHLLHAIFYFGGGHMRIDQSVLSDGRRLQ